MSVQLVTPAPPGARLSPFRIDNRDTSGVPAFAGMTTAPGSNRR
jgi:hypothetical protein